MLVDTACRYPQSRQLDGAIEAGANLFLAPEPVTGARPIRGAWSPSARRHTFDAKADGYCTAKAVNVVLLRQLADAVCDSDLVRAVIRGRHEQRRLDTRHAEPQC
jgi:acyl transferase domain-containing protein